ncbi:TetR/AcrR family transcriptional regulator [Sphaerisporangium fuscum]|uniref:TetR/AcrR family transcriptional regulator n=1 Tax=Sphaerisporangium fuscum TaxID=2835868 RepID=UPI001BDD8EE4|nr:TetR/AcrR family transcriptional regulator [Sphaerisporangium fuscum]
MRLSRAEARERSRRALIEAAAEEISDRGYAAARLEDIASRAEVTTGSIYSIFGSKLNLIAAAMAHLAHDLYAEMVPVISPGEDPTIEEVLRSCARRFQQCASTPQAQRYLHLELELASLALTDKETFAQADLPQDLALTIATLLTGRRLADDSHDRTTPAQGADLAPAVHALLLGLFQARILNAEDMSPEYYERAAVALLGMLHT